MKERESRITHNNSISAKKEGNVIFNDALNTFYLRVYGVRYGKGPFR